MNGNNLWLKNLLHKKYGKNCHHIKTKKQLKVLLPDYFLHCM
jgi:hypothetical protein